MKKNEGCISFDLDNLWSYLKVHGRDSWRTFPSYFDLYIPKILKLLDDLNLKSTFFIVGKDASLPKNREYIKALVAGGHEVANHSFYHDPGFSLQSIEAIEKEIMVAEEAIFESCGARPIGFRAPCFGWSPSLIDILSKRGYKYDSSLLPSFIGPIARLYFRTISNVSRQDRTKNVKQFGSLKDGLTPLKPYLMETENSNILELPMTSFPVIRMPCHMSYLLYLYTYSEKLMNAYLNGAIALCCLRGISMNFLFHPTDLLGADMVPQMKFFPGMSIASARKQELLHGVISKLQEKFTLVKMSEKAESLNSQKNLKVKKV